MTAHIAVDPPGTIATASAPAHSANAAVDLASVEGLEGLTIAAAREIFVAELVEPARRAEPGLPRLAALLDAKLDYIRRGVFRGGCFFDAARLEYDSRHPGPVRDAILEEFDAWSQLVADRVRAAQREGHLDPQADPDQVAFELDAIGTAANVRFQIHRDGEAFGLARTAIEARLQALAAQ